MKNTRTRSLLVCLRTLACLLGPALCSRATTVVVTNLADSGPGTLRDAVAFANTNAGGADITFDPALSGQTITLTSGQVTLSNQMTMVSSGLPAGLAISGNTNSRICEVTSKAVVTIRGFLLENGRAPGNGGAVLVDDGGMLTIINSTVSGSSAGQFGGGILNRGTLLLRDSAVQFNVAGGTGGGIRNEGTLTGTNCFILGNLANNGGGVVTTNMLTADRWTVSGNRANHNTGGIENDIGTLTITNSSISGNSAAHDGGGIGNYASGTVIVNGSTISGNSATNNGGGLFINNGGVTIANSSFTSNTATTNNGGGIYNGGTLTINNSTLSENAAQGDGGGIINDRTGTLRINNSTFTRNSAIFGGGIENLSGTNILNNCTLSGNSAYGGGGIFNGGPGALSFTNTVAAGNTATIYPNFDNGGSFSALDNFTNGNPQLAPLGNYGGPTQTMPPLAGSPVINAGYDAVANFLATDQRGYPRLSGAHVDIGAVELQGVIASNPPLLMNSAAQANGSLTFSFTNIAGAEFTVLTSTNLTLPLNQWSNLGLATQGSPGLYQFTDPDANNYPQRFYQVVSP